MLCLMLIGAHGTRHSLYSETHCCLCPAPPTRQPRPPAGTLLCDRDNEDGSLVNPARLSAQIVCPPGCLGADVTKTVWGTGVYTSGSPICLAAIHAGVLTDAGGTATLYYQPGQPTYAGSSAHGVSSSAYGEWAASFSFAA